MNGINREELFSDVIWNEIYFNDSNVGQDVLNCLSEYICDEISRLSNVNDLDFLNGWWQFGPVPTIDKYRSQNMTETMFLHTGDNIHNGLNSYGAMRDQEQLEPFRTTLKPENLRQLEQTSARVQTYEHEYEHEHKREYEYEYVKV